jgi:lipopolysaccharide assembly protein A
LVILRRLVLFATFALFVLAAAMFSYGNPGRISVDVGLFRLESVSMTVAFAGAFAFGTVFGLCCAGLAMLRMAREKRQLRRDLRYAEAELSTLRSMPLQDAN